MAEARAIEEQGGEAGAASPLVVLGGRVPDVERLVGGDSGEGEGRVEDPARGLGDSDESRDDDAVEVSRQVETVEESGEGGVPVADDDELQPSLAERREDLEDLRVEAPVFLPVEVDDELVEEPFRESSASDLGEDLLDEAAPEASLPVAVAPAFLAGGLPRRDDAPRSVKGRQDGLVRGGDAPAAERPPVDLFDGGIGREERVSRVEEDRFRLLQGITCPPSMTIDWPVTLRASPETSQATRPAISSGTRTCPSGAIFPAAAKASSSVRPMALP